jgi:hypothetical protein
MHLIRHSLEFVSWKDRKPVVPALRAIYRAKDAEAGMKTLEEFEAGYWGQRYPAITQSWRRNWQHVVPFFAFPEACAGSSTPRRDRGAELETAPRRSHPRPFPQRRRGIETVISGPEPRRRRIGNDRRASGSRPKPSSPSSSAKGSSANHENGLAHRIPDSPTSCPVSRVT